MSEEEINAARTPRGGWTKEQLAQWGVPWPPPKGWKESLVLRHSISEAMQRDAADHMAEEAERLGIKTDWN